MGVDFIFVFTIEWGGGALKSLQYATSAISDVISSLCGYSSVSEA